MIKYIQHKLALRLVRDGVIGANTYNAIHWYLYGDKDE